MEREQDFDNEIEIDLKDLFLEIISYWQWIILVTIATGAVAFAISRFMITPMYESTSELYVLSKSTSITSLADIQTGTSLTDPMELVINTHNRNAMLLQRAEKYKKVGIARVVIIENIKQRILGNASRWNSIIDFGGELVHQYELEKPMSLQAQWCLEIDFPDEINAYIAKNFTDREIADYGLTMKDFIKWWMAP